MVNGSINVIGFKQIHDDVVFAIHLISFDHGFTLIEVRCSNYSNYHFIKLEN